MKKIKLGTKLVTGGIVVVLVPLLTVGIIFMIMSSAALKDLEIEQFVNLRTTLANYVDEVITQEKGLIKNFAKSSVIMSCTGQMNMKMDNVVQFYLDKDSTLFHDKARYENFFLVGKDGIIAADASKGASQGIDISKEEYFNRAMNGETLVGKVVQSKDTGEPLAFIASPLADEDGQVIGIMVSQFRVLNVNEKIAVVKIGETGYVFVVDKTGAIICHPDCETIMNSNILSMEGLEGISEKMLSGAEGIENYTYEGSENLLAFAPANSAGWSLGITIPESEYMAPITSMRNMMLVIGLIFMVAAIIAIWRFSKAITGKIGQVVDNIKQVADDTANGKLDSRADVESAGIDFKEIPAGFNTALDAVIAPLNMMAEYVDRISKGDIPEKITDDYKGDFNKLKFHSF